MFDENTRRLILLNPELMKVLDLHGVERAAAGFEIMLAATPRDDRGHFYKDAGAPCPHKKGGRTDPKETAESVQRKEEGVKAIKSVLSGRSERAGMRTASGRKVIFEKGTDKYGVEHLKLRRYNSGDAKTDADFDRIIDGVSKAIANAEPYNFYKSKKIVYEYKGFLAVCEDNDTYETFITGYKKYKAMDEK